MDAYHVLLLKEKIPLVRWLLGDSSGGQNGGRGECERGSLTRSRRRHTLRPNREAMMMYSCLARILTLASDALPENGKVEQKSQICASLPSITSESQGKNISCCQSC